MLEGINVKDRESCQSVADKELGREPTISNKSVMYKTNITLSGWLTRNELHDDHHGLFLCSDANVSDDVWVLVLL